MKLVLRKGELLSILPDDEIMKDLVLMEKFDKSTGKMILGRLEQIFQTRHFEYQPTWTEDNRTLPTKYRLMPIVILCFVNGSPTIISAKFDSRTSVRVLRVNNGHQLYVLESQFVL